MGPNLEIEIVQASSEEELEGARALFREYAERLGVSLCFQGFEDELAGLPGKYAPPRGCLLLAKSQAGCVGCVALRPLEDGQCEMKRLYVRSFAQGRGIGRELAVRCVEMARSIGYHVLRLDTLRRLRPALQLYASLGFVEIPAYCLNPLEDVVYLEKRFVPAKFDQDHS